MPDLWCMTSTQLHAIVAIIVLKNTKEPVTSHWTLQALTKPGGANTLVQGNGLRHEQDRKRQKTETKPPEIATPPPPQADQTLLE